jgi:hypothetical protein
MKEPKIIDLPPTEYRADFPNKREPIFGPGAATTGLSLLVYVIVGTAVRWWIGH